MIRRDFAAASRQEFDLVVVGGGIYGVSLLQEAARRGLSACLCEAADFGGATSWNSLRIVHGGLRYLQTLDMRRFFQSVAARRRLAQQFPALVRPLDCLMPLYGQGMKRTSVMRTALLVNDGLSARRNVGVREAVRLAAGRILDAAATRRAFSRVRPDGLQGAACWQDHLMVSSERILIELLHDACRQGAIALNYAPVTDILVKDGIARGVRVRDAVSGQDYRVSARAVVNCAGPQVRNLARGRGGDAEGLFRPSLAFNLMLDVSLPTESALAVAAPEPGAPVLFVVPLDGVLLAGTMHLPRPADTTEAIPTEAELQHFLDLLNGALPGLDARLANVRRVFAGLLPVTRAHGTELAKRETLVDHGEAGGIQRFYSVSGVKFTTANDVARRVLALMGARGAQQDRTETLELSALTGLLTDACGFLVADRESVAHAVRSVIEQEAVQSVDDLVLRRTNWAATQADLEGLRARIAGLSNLPDASRAWLDVNASQDSSGKQQPCR